MDDQEEIINKLTERVKAEQATALELRRQNDLAEQSLNALQKSQQLEKQRNRLWLDISERTANIVQQLPEMARQIYGYDEKLDELPDLIEELSERFDQRLDRIERALIHILSGDTNSRKAKGLAKSIEQGQQQRLIEQLKRRLDKLEMKRASYGDLNAPPHLLMEIEDTKSEIEQLEE